ncbi:DUF3276 family protein [Candidatus Poribacteria bacterium]|nr:DUF3276 family protein [Candidatus Poribacteria bacterium]
MANYEELFTRRFGGGKRTYYLDVKRDSNGDKYVVISESTRKEGERKMRNRVMVWREDFENLFNAMREMESFLAATDSRDQVQVSASAEEEPCLEQSAS